MKKLRFLLILATLVALPILAIRYVLEERTHAEQKVREAAYQSALRSYTQVFKPGASRKQVEGYLHGREIDFRQMCCVGRRNTETYDDLVRIGQEDPPFICEGKNIYVAFQFSGREPLDIPKANATDKLDEITIFRWLEGCL